MSIQIFLDTGDLQQIDKARQNPLVKGFTTNPSLIRAAGVTDYESFARDAAIIAGDLPISLEVIADDFVEMEHQARVLSALGDNVYVKIPITDTSGRSTLMLAQRLSETGVKVNVTAVFTAKQSIGAMGALRSGSPSIVSIFAGRIADTGRDPRNEVWCAADIARRHPQIRILWASTREPLNVKQAEAAGAHIITVSQAILDKLSMFGHDIEEYSLETVRQFYRDAQASGYTIGDHR